MNVWHLVFREIVHRKGNFVLGVFSVIVAVGCLVGTLTLFAMDNAATAALMETQKKTSETLVAEREKEVQTAGDKLKDSMRKITKGLGFNILILPEQQDLNELQVEGTLTHTMQEEYATRLAETKIVTINHLLPILMKKTEWKELGRTVILTGTRGEVPLMHRALKKPLLDHVAPGEMVVGYQLHSPSNEAHKKVSKGDEVTLLGKKFKVNKVLEERGTADDYTVWINLKEAQELSGKENLIHAILALECNCATEDRVAEIRQEIAGILPGTQVIERGPPALARAEARNQAAKTAQANLVQAKETGTRQLEELKTQRAELRQKREAFGSIMVPTVLLASGIWIGLLAYNNVRQRSGEIGILRAIGLRSQQILVVFLAKACLVGLIGAVLGFVIGLQSGQHFGPDAALVESLNVELNWKVWMIGCLIAAPILSSIASWLPAVLASQQDPASVLQHDT